MALVSVLISAFNVEEYVKESIESILDQSFSDLEVLVADDCSTDNTFAVLNRIKDDRVALFKNATNQGKSKTLNDLFKKSKGEFVLIHDADDLSDFNRIEVLLQAFRRDDSIGLVMSGHRVIVDGVVTAPKSDSKSKEECRELISNYKMPAHDPTMMIRSKLFSNVLFNPELFLGEGLDFILRCGELSEILVVPDVLYTYRIHSDSITKRKSDDKVKQIFKVISDARKRRLLPEITVEEFLKNADRSILIKNNNLSGHFTSSVKGLCINKKFKEGFNVAFFSLRYLFKDFMFIKPMLIFIKIFMSGLFSKVRFYIHSYARMKYLFFRTWILRNVFGMDVAYSSRISRKAKLDFTNPSGIKIGENSYVAFGSTMLTHDMSRNLKGSVIVGDCCFIGANSIILPNVTLGNCVIVAAGSVVTKSFRSNVIVAGNPAVVIKDNIKVGKYGIIIENE